MATKKVSRTTAPPQSPNPSASPDIIKPLAAVIWGAQAAPSTEICSALPDLTKLVRRQQDSAIGSFVRQLAIEVLILKQTQILARQEQESAEWYADFSAQFPQ